MLIKLCLIEVKKTWVDNLRWKNSKRTTHMYLLKCNICSLYKKCVVMRNTLLYVILIVSIKILDLCQ